MSSVRNVVCGRLFSPRVTIQSIYQYYYIYSWYCFDFHNCLSFIQKFVFVLQCLGHFLLSTIINVSITTINYKFHNASCFSFFFQMSCCYFWRFACLHLYCRQFHPIKMIWFQDLVLKKYCVFILLYGWICALSCTCRCLHAEDGDLINNLY